MQWLRSGDINQPSGLAFDYVGSEASINKINITKSNDLYTAKLTTKAPIWVKTIKHELHNGFTHSTALEVTDADNKFVIIKTNSAKKLIQALRICCGAASVDTLGLFDMDQVQSALELKKKADAPAGTSTAPAGTSTAPAVTSTAPTATSTSSTFIISRPLTESEQKIADLRAQAAEAKVKIASGENTQPPGFKFY